MSTSIAALLVLLLLPIVLLAYFTESRSTRLQRMRSNGWTVTAIAKRYGCSRSTIRRWCA